MKEHPRFQAVACLAFCSALFLSFSQAGFTTFAIGEAGRYGVVPRSQPVKVSLQQDFSVRDSSKGANLASFCSLTFLGVVVAACGASRVVMHGQGQGGRFNLGQPFFPKLKGAKKLAVLRKRKVYGSKSAQRRPTRYPIYDELEELDTKLPWYTVLSEPDEPMKSDRDAPLLERYPWADSFKTPEKKQTREEDTKKALEPLFGNFIYETPPPLTRHQRYIHRRGYPTYNTPPWINNPVYGTKWPSIWSRKARRKKGGELPFKKDRRIGKEDQLPELEAGEIDDGFDDMDEVLDALDEGEE